MGSTRRLRRARRTRAATTSRSCSWTPSYDGDAFKVEHYVFGEELATKRLELRGAAQTAAHEALVILMDTHGNELRQVVDLDTLKVGEVTPRAALASDRFSAGPAPARGLRELRPRVLRPRCLRRVHRALAPTGRDYQAEATRIALRYFLGGRYANTEQLARESFDASQDLQRLYASADALVERLPFADKLACTLDLATGTGKSYVMYAVARVMLNEGAVDRVLVLCPSLTIEAGLIEKFNALTADGDLTDLLPVRPAGTAIPTIVDAGSTVNEGDICIENIHAAYERTGSSLADSFTGVGRPRLVISDEAHHVIAAAKAQNKKWHDFLANPDLRLRLPPGRVRHLLRRQQVLHRRRLSLRDPRRDQRQVGQGDLLPRRGRLDDRRRALPEAARAAREEPQDATSRLSR